MLRLLVLHHRYLLIVVLVSAKELLVPLETHDLVLFSLSLNEIDYVVRLQNLNQKYRDDMSGMCVESLVVLLCLEYVDQISALI